ncbi:hypothetical protein E4U15_004233 [Claviceps sp. LM218 group G6]|nr:hypothetical protein E4U15_004233 [Claviceps sp. LM218 group G6]KAG6109597.1 hypothetical protein E4U14_003160 [Claviceps sp. LM454 group G7]
MHALSLLALLLPLVKANLHNQCDCMTWNQQQPWIHNAELTEYICVKEYPGAAQFDKVLKRCVANPGWTFDGQAWEDQCKYASAHGYYPIKNGKEDLWWAPATDAIAVGSCPDRN